MVSARLPSTLSGVEAHAAATRPCGPGRAAARAARPSGPGAGSLYRHTSAAHDRRAALPIDLLLEDRRHRAPRPPPGSGRCAARVTAVGVGDQRVPGLERRRVVAVAEQVAAPASRAQPPRTPALHGDADAVGGASASWPDRPGCGSPATRRRPESARRIAPPRPAAPASGRGRRPAPAGTSGKALASSWLAHGRLTRMSRRVGRPAMAGPGAPGHRPRPRQACSTRTSSPSITASTRPAPACIPATSSACSRCVACSLPAIRSCRSSAAAPGSIGDPSGRDEERVLLSEAELEANVVAIRHQVEQLLDADPGRTSCRRSSPTTGSGSASSRSPTSFATSASTSASTR